MEVTPVVETYEVQFLNGPLSKVDRWTLPDYPSLLMGGTILGVKDWEHLQRDFGVTHVLSVESEHSDRGVVPDDRLLATPVLDNGAPKPAEVVRSWIEFARKVVTTGNGKLYVHCQAGGSRTPMVVYALLRSIYGKTKPEALSIIQIVKPSWGPPHGNYIGCVEWALTSLPGWQ